jgi:hypothetical protein
MEGNGRYFIGKSSVFNCFWILANLDGVKIGVPYGIRTRVASVKGRCPRPLDEGDIEEKSKKTSLYNVLGM